MPKVPVQVDLEPLTALIARLELSTALLEQHIADELGHCRVCTRQQHSVDHPCSIRFRAEQAAS